MTTQTTARCAAFGPVATHRLMIDDDGTVRVWDGVAGFFTTAHRLSEAAQRRRARPVVAAAKARRAAAAAMGSSRSPAKQAASRANGARGGRPRTVRE